MKTAQKKQNPKRSKQKTTSSPREEVIRWVKEFVEVPHPVFADYPPCPYAKQARLDGKVDFVELTDMEPDSNIWTSIDHFDFENKDVLVIIADAKRWTPHYTLKLAEQLNGTYQHRDLLIMEDHPKLKEQVKDVKLNQGKYTLLFVQSRVKLKKFEDILKKTDYYHNWSTKYRESVTGNWRHPLKSRS
jgi:predicted nuclease of restriction endonuclease-like RecB superfamily